MVYQEVFNQFMNLIKPFMKSHGFTTRGNNFYIRHQQGNIGMINFQKSISFPRFTINVSIYSYILAEAFLAEFGEKEVKKYPSEWDCHWRMRISSLIPKQSSDYRNLGKSRSIDKRCWLYDLWWQYNDETDVKELFDEVSPLIVKFAVPEIDQRITDEQLQNAWLAGKWGGNSESDTLQYLATFFLASDEEEKLKTVLNKLGKIVQDNPKLTGVKRKYDTFMKERRWVDDAYIQELEKEKELYRSKKRKKKQ